MRKNIEKLLKNTVKYGKIQGVISVLCKCFPKKGGHYNG